MRRPVFALFLSLLFAILVLPSVANGQAIVGDATAVLEGVRGDAGVSKTDITTGSGEVIRVILTVVGAAFFILMVYAGMLWMTARGEDDQIGSARKTVIAATIGLLITASAYGVTLLITEGLIQGTTDSSPPAVGSVQTGDGTTSPLVCCLIRVRREQDDALDPAFARVAAYMTTEEQCDFDRTHPAEDEEILGSAIERVDARQCKPALLP